MNKINASIDAQQLQPLNQEISKSRPLSTYDNLTTSSTNSTMFGNHAASNSDTSSSKQISSKNEPPSISNNSSSSEKLFKFHDSTYEKKSDVDKRKMIAENNNNSNNNDDDDHDHDNNDDYNNDINHHKVNANTKGHLMTVNINKNSNNNNNKHNNNNNNINNNYGNTPVACDNTNSNNNNNNSNDCDLSQYKNVGELMKLHRAKILNDARSSFFGLIPTTSSRPTKSIDEQTMNNPNFCDQSPLISTNLNGNNNNNNCNNNDSNVNSASASANRSKPNEYQNIPSNSAYFYCNNNSGALSTDRKHLNANDRNNSWAYNDEGGDDVEKSNPLNENGSPEISFNMTTHQSLVPENDSLLSSPTQVSFIRSF